MGQNAGSELKKNQEKKKQILKCKGALGAQTRDIYVNYVVCIFYYFD